MTALCDLFDMGNYSKSHGNGRHVGALDLARNTIRHVSIELEVLGSAAVSEDPSYDADDVSAHCYRLAFQLRAALELVDAVEKSEAGQ
jgi:hypothetical protein